MVFLRCNPNRMQYKINKLRDVCNEIKSDRTNILIIIDYTAYI